MDTESIRIERRGAALTAVIPTRTGDIAILSAPWAPGAERGVRATARAMLQGRRTACASSILRKIGPIVVSRREDHTRWRLPRVAVHRHTVALGWHNTSYVATW